VAGIRAQLERFIDFDDSTSGAKLVNNYDWTGGVGVLDFLRDVGKHITVNQMMAKDSVRSRLESENGISYTEFSYMLLQAFDYWWLYENEQCVLQIGGSDQWGNITAGTELIRKRSGATVHALTWPLLVRSDGQKFGKSQAGNVWLDAARTLPYEFHQYFLRVPDADLHRMLLQLTLLPVEEAGEIVEAHNAAHMAEALRGIVPETSVTSADFSGEQNLVSLLVESGLCKSRSDARRKIGENQISVNRSKVSTEAIDGGSLIGGRYVLLQRGKKERHLVVVD